MNGSRSVLTCNAVAFATILVPIAAGVRRKSGDALLQRFGVGLISLCCSVQGFGAFVESDGLVVMEAEHYQSTTSASAHSWIPTNSPAGFVGASALLAAPNSGANLSTDITNTSPGLTYAIQFTRTGSYKLWIRGWAAGGSDDSVHVGVDGQVVRTLAYSQAGAWTWMGVPVSITSAARHEINLWMREDGAYVDRLLMTTNMTFVPTGNGPPESTQSGTPPNSTPAVQITSPAQGATFLSGTAVSVRAAASHSDDTMPTVNFYANGELTATDTNSPFGFSWSPVPGGYELVAVATNNLGTAVTSAPVNVTIAARPSFAVEVISPPYGASYPAGTMVQISADATNLDGSVTGVNFYLNGALVASDTKAPYTFDWAPPEGICELVASATDSIGQTSSSPAVLFTMSPPASFRYARSSETIYVEGGGSATLSAIQAALPDAPLFLTDPANRIWYLGARIVVADGSTLMLHGGALGGDVNELRLKSNNSSETNNFVTIDADWGTLDLRSVKVTSWDDQTGGPDTEHTVFKRAFIRARSRLVGSVAQQSTLNVIDSEISHLGYKIIGAFALTWQVVGSAADVRVFGEVSGSLIHDCQLDVGTWAADDVSWSGNEISSNTLYGFVAADPVNQTVLANSNVHDNDYGATFRWASASHRIYVTGPGSATLSDIKAALPSAPLTLVNSPSPSPATATVPPNPVWYLGAHLFVENGAQLKLHGPAIGGDVTELRLQSDNSPVTNSYVELRADWGWLDIRNTKITSWDNAVNGPDTETTTFRRAFIRARSKLDPDGVTARESRMDIVNSEISYLGSHNTEAYGLTWKVVDTTAVYLPPGSTNTLFDLVNVYGDILNSHIHHNFFGVYTYGHHGGHWATNEVDHNIAYGFDPHDDSDLLVIEHNNVHHNGWHGIIASKRCDHGVMRNNVSWNNGLDLVDPHGNGIMLHRSCNDWVVEDNQSYGNADSGIAIFASERNLIRNNVCLNNTNAGIRLSVGAKDNWVEGNELGFTQRYGMYIYQGNDPPEPDANGGPGSPRCRNNTFTNNLVHDYTAEGIKLSNCDSNAFLGNSFIAGVTTLRFEGGTDNLMLGNLVPANAIVKVTGDSTNSCATLFKSQPRLTVQLTPFSTATFADDNGAVFDFLQTGVATVADTSGSFASVTAAEVGLGANTVATRKLFVAPNSGGVLVDLTTWELSSNFNKAWTAQASNASAQITYVVGDLRPGSSYRVRRGQTQLARLTADQQGFISFVTTPGTTAALSYTVRRN